VSAEGQGSPGLSEQRVSSRFASAAPARVATAIVGDAGTATMAAKS